MSRRVIAQPLPQDLRNWSFRGLDCAGWDFSGRDIRGCDFSDAKLQGANFKQVIAGRSQQQFLVELAIAAMIAILCGIACLVISSQIRIFPGMDITAAIAVTVIFFFSPGMVIVILGLYYLFLSLIHTPGIFTSVEYKVADMEMSVGVFGSWQVIAALVGILVGVSLRAIVAFSQIQIPSGLFWSASAIGLLLLVLNIMPRAFQASKYATGTNFESADLQGINFSSATLNNCNFYNADERYVNWSHAKINRSAGLFRSGVINFSSIFQISKPWLWIQLLARLGHRRLPIDFTDTRSQLLISRKGKGGLYSDMNLNHCQLAGLELIKANLSGSHLTRSNLQHANLTFANLTHVKACGTDFRHAILTGACISNWKVNSTTRFDNLICDYVYLTPDRTPQSRRPLVGSFARGDFEKLIATKFDIVNLILRRGDDPLALSEALDRFNQGNPETHTTIEDLRYELILVEITVPEGTDPNKIYAAFQDSRIKLPDHQQKVLDGLVTQLRNAEEGVHHNLMRWYEFRKDLVNFAREARDNPQDPGK